MLIYLIITDNFPTQNIDFIYLILTDNGDNTATDNLTGLIWLEDTNCIATSYPDFDNYGGVGDGIVTWQSALDFVSGVNDGTYPDCRANYNDWRLPNHKELFSLIDAKNVHPALPSGHPFFNVGSQFYWSSSTSALYSLEAWAVLIGTGRVTTPSKFEGCSVWPVRGGH